MSNKVKTIIHKEGLLIIETPLGIINIRVGLHDMYNRTVDSIQILNDPEFVELDGYSNNRLINKVGRNEL